MRRAIWNCFFIKVLRNKKIGKKKKIKIAEEKTIYFPKLVLKLMLSYYSRAVINCISRHRILKVSG